MATPRAPLPTIEARKTTSDTLADALRDAILTGVFQDGQELNQVALAKQFGVSRVPLREALRQLQAEGLVRGEAYLRTVVNGLSLDRVTEIIDIRIVMEAFLLSRAIERADDDWVKGLKKLCREMDGVEDHEPWLEANRRFHEALYEPADAPIATEFIHGLSKRVERYLRLWSGGQGIQRNKAANAEHREIVACIEAGDRRKAVAELKRHISTTRAHVVDLYEAYTADAAQAAKV